MTVCRSQGTSTRIRWYLVRTKARGETTALKHLERQGFCVYFPRILQPRRVRSRWVDSVQPLFPRYLFLQLDVVRQSFRPVRSTVGVTNIVRFGDEYAIVPDEVVQELMNNADPETGLYRLREPPFVHGEQVRISEGPFDGLQGVFERYDGEERVVILLEVMGRVTEVRMALEQVIPEPA